MLMKKKKIEKQTPKTSTFKRYSYLIIGCFLLSLSFNLFFLPNNIVYGGVTGVSIIVNSLFKIDPSIFILIVDLILLVISYFLLGWEKTKGSIAGSLLYPLLVKATASIATVINFNVDNMLLIVVFGGIVTGIGAGINFKSGFTTGGTDIVNQILVKYMKISMGKAIIIVDALIVISAGFFLSGDVFFDYEKVMYAIVILYFLSMMTDKVMLGISQSKAFYIITAKEEEVKKFIMDNLSHGVTVLEGHGGYTNDERDVIMCIIPTKKYFILKEGIESIDKNAFFVVTDAYEVSGGE